MRVVVCVCRCVGKCGVLVVCSWLGVSGCVCCCMVVCASVCMLVVAVVVVVVVGVVVVVVCGCA